MDLKQAIDITADQRQTLVSLLDKYLPNTQAWIYGSRVNGTSRPGSDLDMVVFSPPEQGPEVSELREAFDESNLPFRVDLFVWDEVPEIFQEEIEQGHVALVNGAGAMHWREVSIGEIAEVIGGSTPSTKERDNFDGNVPWLTPKDLSHSQGRYVARGARNLSRKGLESCSAKLVPSGAILLSTRAPIGYVALAANPIATNQGFRSLITKNSTNPEFLYYWLKLNHEELERHSSGSTFRELSGSALKDIRLRLPILSQQRAIADILGALDEKIELNRRMNETLEAMARAIFKDWFVDFGPTRAKAEGRAPYLGSELWELFPDALDGEDKPVGWSFCPVSDLFEFNPHESVKKGTYTPYLNMAALPTSGMAADSPTHREYKSGSKFRDGDTLFARITPCLENGKTAYVFDMGNDIVGTGSTEFIVIRSRTPLPKPASYFLARGSEFRAHAERSMTGTSGRQRASREALSQFELAVPPGDTLWKTLGNFITPMMGRIIANAYESRALAETRDLLLPKLMSGEIRLRDAEKAVEAVA